MMPCLSALDCNIKPVEESAGFFVKRYTIYYNMCVGQPPFFCKKIAYFQLFWNHVKKIEKISKKQLTNWNNGVIMDKLSQKRVANHHRKYGLKKIEIF